MIIRTCIYIDTYFFFQLAFSRDELSINYRRLFSFLRSRAGSSPEVLWFMQQRLKNDRRCAGIGFGPAEAFPRDAESIKNP